MSDQFPSVHDSLLDAVVAAVKALELPGILTRVFKMPIMPDEKDMTFPCVYVTLTGQAEEDSEETFRDIGYAVPIGIAIADRNSEDYQKPAPRYLYWRKLMMNYFRRLDRLASVNENWNLRVKPSMIFDPKVKEYQYLVSGFTVLCDCYESRAV